MSNDPFEAEFPEKKKKVENKPSRLKLLVATFAGFGLLYIPLQVMSVLFTSAPEPRWNEVVSQDVVLSSDDTLHLLLWLGYIVVIAIFCRWAWRQDRVIAFIFMTLQSLFIGCYGIVFVLASSLGFERMSIDEIQHEDTIYVLITRNIVPNEVLDLYRCINQQCQGRRIGWNDDTHNGASLSTEGEPPQLMIRSFGTICFDLATFDAEMLTYETRPESGRMREMWESGCEDS